MPRLVALLCTNITRRAGRLFANPYISNIVLCIIPGGTFLVNTLLIALLNVNIYSLTFKCPMPLPLRRTS